MHGSHTLAVLGTLTQCERNYFDTRLPWRAFVDAVFGYVLVCRVFWVSLPLLRLAGRVGFGGNRHFAVPNGTLRVWTYLVCARHMVRDCLRIESLGLS